MHHELNQPQEWRDDGNNQLFLSANKANASKMMRMQIDGIQSQSHSRGSIGIGLFIYIVTGVLQPTFIDYLRLNHLLGHKLLLLPTLANVSGMALCGILTSNASWENFWNSLKMSPRLKKMILLTACVDLISGMCLTFGLLLTGGAIFVVLYNSCPAWTALLTKFVLGKKLNGLQISGVFVVCLGLVINVLGSQIEMIIRSDKEETVTKGKDSRNLTEEQNALTYYAVLGSMIVLVGSMLHSLMFILSDMSMSSVTSDHSPSALSVPGEIFSCCLGSLETIFMTFWVVVGVSIYGFDDDDRLESHESVPVHMAAMGFISLVFVDLLHAVAFFTLLKNLGAMASALLKGVQAIVVIALSAVFYCPIEESQCLTWLKALSATIVLSGVVGYGAGSSRTPKSLPEANNDIQNSDRCAKDRCRQEECGCRSV